MVYVWQYLKGQSTTNSEAIFPVSSQPLRIVLHRRDCRSGANYLHNKTGMKLKKLCFQYFQLYRSSGKAVIWYVKCNSKCFRHYLYSMLRYIVIICADIVIRFFTVVILCSINVCQTWKTFVGIVHFVCVCVCVCKFACSLHYRISISFHIIIVLKVKLTYYLCSLFIVIINSVLFCQVVFIKNLDWR